MAIGILYGEPGAGKSLKSLEFEEPVLVFDMENRLQKKINRFFPEKLIKVLELKLYDKDYNEDKVRSFNEFVVETKKLIQLKSDEMPQTVIIDGIGDIRDYAHDKWCAVTGRKRAVTPGDWESVNDLVRNTLFPPINWARAHDRTLIMTAQMKDNYTVVGQGAEKTSAKDGRTPSYKEFCAYNVDFLIELWQPKVKGKIDVGRYMATCSKAEVGSWELDVTNKNLYEIFKEKGMI